MAKPKVLILMKDLPDCPKGRLFKEDIHGGFFHSMSDEESIQGKLKPYSFSKQQIIDNSEWFSEKIESIKLKNAQEQIVKVGLYFTRTTLGQPAFAYRNPEINQKLHPDEWTIAQLRAVADYMELNPNICLCSDGSGKPCS